LIILITGVFPFLSDDTDTGMRFCYIQAVLAGAVIVSRPRNFPVKIRLASRRRAPDILKITTAPARV